MGVSNQSKVKGHYLHLELYWQINDMGFGKGEDWLEISGLGIFHTGGPAVDVIQGLMAEKLSSTFPVGFVDNFPFEFCRKFPIHVSFHYFLLLLTF